MGSGDTIESEVVVDGGGDEDGVPDDWEGGETEPCDDDMEEYVERDGDSMKFSVGVVEEDDDTKDALSGAGGGSSEEKEDSRALPAFELGMVLSAIGVTVFVVIRKRKR